MLFYKCDPSGLSNNYFLLYWYDGEYVLVDESCD